MTAQRLLLWGGVIVFTVLSAGCGWHLRGSTGSLELDSAAVTGASNDAELVQRLKQTLSNLGAEIVEPAAAQVIVELSDVASARRVLTTDVEGNVSEYVLSYGVSVTVLDSQGQALRQPQRVSLSRDFTFNEAARLEKSSEEALLLREMRTEAVSEILRRVQLTLSRVKR